MDETPPAGPDAAAAEQPPVGSTALVGADLSTSLRRIVEAAVDMLGAAYGVLVLVDAERTVVEFTEHRCDGVHDGTSDDADSPLLGRDLETLEGLRDVVMSDAPVRLEGLDGIGDAVPELAAARTLLSVPVLVRGQRSGAVVVVDRTDGRPFDDENERMLVPLTAAVTASVENDLLYAEMRRRQRWLEASNEVTTTVLSGTPTREVLRLIAERVRECTPADGVAILLVEEDGRMVVEHAVGDASGLFAGMVADDSWASSASVIDTGRPVVIPDLGASRRSDHPAFRRLGACMLLPMRAADQTLGAIAVTNYRDHAGFDPTDLAMAEAFAGQTALAAVLSEARAERERLMIFEERDRIARDLHDLVIQRLFATGMMLQGATRGVTLPPAVEERISRAVDELDATVREIRQTIFALNQPVGVREGMGLRGRILHEAATAVPALGFHPHLRMEGAVDALVPDDVANQLVAATREALSNVARHAHATKVDVHMQLVGDDVVLEVIDDGVGIRDSTRSSGLRNLRNRAATVGGWCGTWPSKPDGTGTRLTFKARIR